MSIAGIFVVMNNNTLTLLLCLAFGGIGFAIGRVSSPSCDSQRGHCKSEKSCGDHRGCAGATSAHCGGHGAAIFEDVELIVTELEGLGKDTVLFIPGGEIVIQREGEEVEVTVEMAEGQEGKRIIERRVILEKEGDR